MEDLRAPSPYLPTEDLKKKLLSRPLPAVGGSAAGEICPGLQANSEAALSDDVRAAGTTIYHPVGTCKMGDGPSAVVDPRLRVRGLTGLRVIDASIMPAVTTGNTNAPAIMIAEKGASMVLVDAKVG